MVDRMPMVSPTFMVFVLVKVFTYYIKFNLYGHFVIRSYSNTYQEVKKSYFCALFKDNHLRFLLYYRMSQIHPRRTLRSVIFDRLTFNIRLPTFILSSTDVSYS